MGDLTVSKDSNIALLAKKNFEDGYKLNTSSSINKVSSLEYMNQNTSSVLTFQKYSIRNI